MGCDGEYWTPVNNEPQSLRADRVSGLTLYGPRGTTKHIHRGWNQATGRYYTGDPRGHHHHSIARVSARFLALGLILEDFLTV